jgi:hypothetical protein
MVMGNPYTDEPYQTCWQQGFEHGQQSPSDTDPTPPDYSSWGYDASVTDYCGQVWKEGALAGREQAGGGGSSGGSSNADGTVTLPTDVVAELTGFYEHYPETAAMVNAGDGETYLRQNVGIADVPQEGDDDPAIA